MQTKEVLGIDVGASGIKGAIVDVHTGTLLTERLRVETPFPATPEAMALAFRELYDQFDYKGAVIGCGFPSVIKEGRVCTAANIDKSWIGVDVGQLFGQIAGKEVQVLNDADAAGIASMKFGIGRKAKGTVIFITIGSGLGSALFTNGRLVPNTELGHFYIEGEIAEHYASAKTRKEQNLSWEEWGQRFNKYLHRLDFLLSPDLILLGGGSSKHFEHYAAYITLLTPVVPSKLLNHAGIIGAAYHAHLVFQKEGTKKPAL